MPPKKTVQAKVKKIVEDKTFGLKNKNKSKKVQAYMQQVEQGAALIGKNHKQAKLEEAAHAAKLAAKKAGEIAKKEQAELFKVVVKEQVLPFGVDPKSVVCNFFRADTCTKGAKCKSAGGVLKIGDTAPHCSHLTYNSGAVGAVCPPKSWLQCT